MRADGQDCMLVAMSRSPQQLYFWCTAKLSWHIRQPRLRAIVKLLMLGNCEASLISPPSLRPPHSGPPTAWRLPPSCRPFSALNTPSNGKSSNKPTAGHCGQDHPKLMLSSLETVRKKLACPSKKVLLRDFVPFLDLRAAPMIQNRCDVLLVSPLQVRTVRVQAPPAYAAQARLCKRGHSW